MNNQFYKERIQKAKERIVSYEDAIDQLLANQIESYQLDTGQSVQRVTKMNIEVLEKAIDTLLNRCATWEARITGCGTTYVRPGF